MWTKSAQRKMVRLYVYTTLPLNKILEVIHRNNSAGTPGTDSANKNLNSLLDKEPRWLHPRNIEDMGRRVNQLSQSVGRLTQPTEADADDQHTPATHSRSSSDPLASRHLSVNIKDERSLSPSLLEVPNMNWGAPSSPPSPTRRAAQSQPCSPTAYPLGPEVSAKRAKDEAAQEALFSTFLRRTTAMSSSTDDSTGSLEHILSGYARPYVRVVKKLVRRFTATPTNSQAGSSPTPESVSTIMDWLDDDNAPTRYDEGPYPLPGDFLFVDVHGQSPICPADAMSHYNKRCLCSAARDIQNSPWVTSAGLTSNGMRILAGGLQASDLSGSDAFQNSVLHFIAARGSIHQLYNAISHDLPLSLLRQTNTAGQTFLHVVNPNIADDVDSFCALVNLAERKGFDIYTCDYYGRTIFHIPTTLGISPTKVHHFQRLCNRSRCNRTDAFGVRPMTPPSGTPAIPDSNDAMDLDNPSIGSSSGQPSQDDRVTAETEFLAKVYFANDNPEYEDENGRNGLHCLASSTMSVASLAEKLRINLETQPLADQKKVKKQPDSSKDRLQLRHNTAIHLLQVGADPNHYDYDGNTPLMAFAAQLPEDGDYRIGPQILQTLIKGGANIHARNRAGETALHIAVRCGRKLAVKELVSAGANVNARDAMGRSVLDVADAKINSAGNYATRDYVRFEACRAWLSGSLGSALQNPSVLDEWSARGPA